MFTLSWGSRPMRSASGLRPSVWPRIRSIRRTAHPTREMPRRRSEPVGILSLPSLRAILSRSGSGHVPPGMESDSMFVIRWLSCVVSLAAFALPLQNPPVQSNGNQATGNSASATPAAEKTASHSTARKTRGPEKTFPNIVLITLDTTRADRMGFLGSRRGLTPNLDGLARQSAVFTRAYAQAPLTSPSHATILTGTYPQFHQVYDFPDVLAEDLPYAPAILRSRGYHTAAFIGSIALDPNGGAPGFDRGFDTYDAGFSTAAFDKEEDRYRTVERRGGEVVEHALAWLNSHPQGPFFMWVHLYDPHEPYEPPEPYRSRYAAEPYDGENDHGFFLYDETIRVPLVIKLPQAGAAEKRIENRVELVDVMPTLLQIAGAAGPAGVPGKSLVGLMKAGEAEATDSWRDRPAYSESDYPHIAFGWSALQSLRTGKYLYIQAPRRELYDQTVDPEAEHNLAATSPAVADTLGGQVRAIREKTTSKRAAPKLSAEKVAALYPAAQAKLASLGYVASGSHVFKSSDQEPDPKDKIGTIRAIRRVNDLMADEH